MGLYDNIRIEHPDILREFGEINTLQTKSLDRFMYDYVVDCLGMLYKLPSVHSTSNWFYKGTKLEEDVYINDGEFCRYSGKVIAYGTDKEDKDIDIELTFVDGMLKEFKRAISRVDLYDIAREINLDD